GGARHANDPRWSEDPSARNGRVRRDPPLTRLRAGLHVPPEFDCSCDSSKESGTCRVVPVKPSRDDREGPFLDELFEQERCCCTALLRRPPCFRRGESRPRSTSQSE